MAIDGINTAEGPGSGFYERVDPALPQFKSHTDVALDITRNKMAKMVLVIIRLTEVMYDDTQTFFSVACWKDHRTILPTKAHYQLDDFIVIIAYYRDAINAALLHLKTYMANHIKSVEESQKSAKEAKEAREAKEAKEAESENKSKKPKKTKELDPKNIAKPFRTKYALRPLGGSNPAPAALGTNNNVDNSVTVQDLVTRAMNFVKYWTKNVDNHVKEEPSLKKLWESKPPTSEQAAQSNAAPKSQPLRPIPSVSPREVLLWSITNTKSFRTSLAVKTDKNRMDLMKCLWKYATPDEVFEGHEDKLSDLQLMSKSENDQRRGREFGPVFPLVFSICTGYSRDGSVLHDVTHVGATKELFEDWLDLHNVREAARDQHIGAQPKEAWDQFVKAVHEVEKAAHLVEDYSGKPPDESHSNAIEVRSKVLQGRLPVEGQLPGRTRDCGLHRNAPYMIHNGRLVMIGCCYVCQLTVGFDEFLPSAPEYLRFPKFKMVDRINIPHSCAEVLCSNYCMPGLANKAD